MERGDLASAVASAIDPASLVQRVCDRTLELIDDAEGVAIGVLDHGSITYVFGAGPGPPPMGTIVTLDGSLSGLAVSTGSILRCDDATQDPRVDAAACRRLAVVSLLCVPLMHGGECCGVMAVNSPRVHAFGDDDVAVLANLADFVSSAVGSAYDIHRASRQLLALHHPARFPGGVNDDVTPRFVMDVLHPGAAAKLDARHQIQEVLADPELVAMVFQPVFDLHSGAVAAVEALARFAVEPIRPPDHWFAAAHLAGLGVELEVLALQRAIDHLPELPLGVRLAVNMGPESLMSPTALDLVTRQPVGRLILELTEHTAFDRYPTLPSTLSQLRRQGAAVAVDDAGSGYSSLTHILRLAPDFIKLDRELIADIDIDPVRRALVSSLVAFAADTGATIVAEGVERADELATVQHLGVRYAQGYHLGRPAPLAESVFHSPRTQEPPARHVF